MKRILTFTFLVFILCTRLYADTSTYNAPPLVKRSGDIATLARDLSIDGDVTANAFWGDGSNLTGVSGADSDWTVSGTNTYTELGNVGIGVSTPDQVLDVIGNIDVHGNLSASDGLTIADTLYAPTISGGAGASDDMLLNPTDDLVITATDIQLTAVGDMTLTGDILAGVKTLSTSGATTLNGTDIKGSVVYAGDNTITLPSIVDGASVSVIAMTATTVNVDPNGSDLIYLDGGALDDGDKITSPGAAGDIAVLTYYSADGWYAATNTWTDGG